MNGFDCKSVTKLSDLAFVCDGFDPKWLDACCEEHESMLIDFILVSILREFRDEYKTSKLYLRLLMKTIEVIRQQKLNLKSEIKQELLDKIVETVTQRDDKLAFEGVELLEKFLRLHLDTCEECCTKDCDYLKFVQDKFVGSSSIRIKIKSTLMVTIVKFSKDWRPTKQQLLDQYKALDNHIDRNQAIYSILALLESFPSDRDLHLPLLKSVLSDSSKNVFISVKDRLLPQIFKKVQLRTWFLSCYGQICGDLDILALLTVSFLMMEVDVTSRWEDFISQEKLFQALLHCDNNIRLMTFRLLCFNKKMSADIQISDLKLIEAFIFTHMATPFPTMRNEIFAIFKKFLIRMSTNIQLKFRNGTMSDELLANFKTFLINIHENSVDSLLSDANFSRRIMSLTFLKQLHILDIFNVDCQGKSLYNIIGLFDASESLKLFEALSLNLCFSYDMVQSLSLNLIEKIDFQIDDETKDNLVMSVLKNADNISTEVQHRVSFQAKVIGLKFPDKLLFVLKELCLKCEERIENKSLNLIVSNHPVHVLLNVISSLISYVSFDELDFIRKHVIDLCFDVTKIVDPVLQSLSPEGMILLDDEDENLQPNDLNKRIPELISEQKLESQTLLVACWRTLKAISSIFATIIESAPDNLLLNEWKELLPKFKDYFWTQLTVCRHKGVFEMAARGFQTMCDRYSKLFSDDEPNSLNPLSWLQDVLTSISGGIDAQLLCLTRRSAGIPHLIVAILKSYQPTLANKAERNAHLDDTLVKLCQCRTFDPVFEIHCVNVLKVLLQNAIFRKQLSIHLENVLLLTFDGLNSKNWSIRNSYSQLFSIIVLRIFGPENYNHIGNGITLKEFSTSFPLAYDELLKLLSCYDQTRECTEPLVQPILAILSHLRPSNLNGECRVNELLANAHNIAFNSKRETVRSLAIHSITSIVSSDYLFEEYFLLYQKLLCEFNSLNNNALTSLFHLIGHIIEKMEDLSGLSKLISAFNVLFEKKFDLFLRNDLTAYHFLRSTIISTHRGFSFDLKHLFDNFSLKDGQFSSSCSLLAELYVKFYENGQIDFVKLPSNFSLHCIEQVLLNKKASISSEIFDVLKEARKRRDFLMIRRIMALLGQNNSDILSKLIEDTNFCDWMTDNELVLLKMDLQMNAADQMTSDQWKDLDSISHNCTPDVAFKILNLIERMLCTQKIDQCIENQIAIFLQNEDSDIREKAASLISQTLCPQMKDKTSYTACWLLSVQKSPEVLKQVCEFNEQTLANDINLTTETYEMDEEKRIFDPIAKNTFVESFVLDRETQAVNYLIERLEC